MVFLERLRLRRRLRRDKSSGLLGALGRDPHRKEGRHRRTRRRHRRANRGLPPLCEARRNGTRDGDCLAPHFHRGRWSPAEATALSTPRARHRGPSDSRRSTRRRSQRSSWRRSVSAPPAGIYSTQRGRGPTKSAKVPGAKVPRYGSTSSVLIATSRFMCTFDAKQAGQVLAGAGRSRVESWLHRPRVERDSSNRYRTRVEGHRAMA